MNALRRRRHLHAIVLAWFMALVLATAAAPLLHVRGAQAAAPAGSLPQPVPEDAASTHAGAASTAHGHHGPAPGSHDFAAAGDAQGPQAPDGHGAAPTPQASSGLPAAPLHAHQAECALCLPATAWLEAPAAWRPARHALPQALFPHAAALRQPVRSAAPATAQAPPPAARASLGRPAPAA